MRYDLFLFCNELDLLEIRFHELATVIDRFVLAEAKSTFSGKRKPLFYADNRSRFAEFADKITHVVINDFPDGADAWAKERWSRDAILRGLPHLSGDDTLILSDVDEIPRADTILAIQPKDAVVALEQDFFYYWLNCKSGTCHHSRIFSPSGLRRANYKLSSIRTYADCHHADGGWHFSFLGGPDAIKRKLESYSHTEFDQDYYKRQAFLSAVTASGLDLFGRDAFDWRFVPLDAGFPEHILNNKPKFRHLWRDVEFNENWCSPSKTRRLIEFAIELRGLPGTYLELGASEGKSTIALANAAYPELVHTVDAWRSNKDDDERRKSGRATDGRDVHSTFLRNLSELSEGNVVAHKADHQTFLREFSAPVKLCHVDGSQDFRSVHRILEAIVPRMVTGGIIVGSDYTSAGMHLNGLKGGVEQAVRGAFGSTFCRDGELWWWRRAT